MMGCVYVREGCASRLQFESAPLTAMCGEKERMKGRGREEGEKRVREWWIAVKACSEHRLDGAGERDASWRAAAINARTRPHRTKHRTTSEVACVCSKRGELWPFPQLLGVFIPYC